MKSFLRSLRNSVGYSHIKKACPKCKHDLVESRDWIPYYDADYDSLDERDIEIKYQDGTTQTIQDIVIDWRCEHCRCVVKELTPEQQAKIISPSK